jgi:heavy metal sensor kinase
VKPLGLRTKLTLAYASILALLLAGFGWFFYHALALRLEKAANEELEERAAGLRGYLRFQDGKPEFDYDPDDPEQAYFVRTATRYYRVYDVNTGELLVESEELRLLELGLSPDQVRRLAQQPHLTEFETRYGLIRFHNYVIHNGPSRSYLMQVGISLSSIQATLNQFLSTLLLLGPAGVLLAALGGAWMARRALRPVEALRVAAHRISLTQLDRRLPLQGSGDEIDRLASTFNQMFARLEDSVRQMKQFTASISHELRTPLTAMRGEAEVTLMRARSAEEYRRVLASQLEEFDKLTQMINRLLTLARAEAGEIPLSIQPVNFSELVTSLAQQVEPVAAWKNVTLRVKAEENIEVAGDEQWLERVVLNLLDNAIKFTPAGGRVEVAIGTEDQQATLEVSDTGTGIPADALPHIFEPFYRGSLADGTHAEGAGLGLSLTRWIVEQHHGKIQVKSRPGEGTCFTVWIPLAQSASPGEQDRSTSRPS